MASLPYKLILREESDGWVLMAMLAPQRQLDCGDMGGRHWPLVTVRGCG